MRRDKEKIIVFGTGSYMKSKLDVLKEKYNIVKFSDNNKENWGKIIENVNVIDPCEILEYNFDYIVIASMYWFEIGKQLIEMGIENKKILLLQNFTPYSNEEELFFKTGKEKFFIDESGDACYTNGINIISINSVDDYYIIKEIWGETVYDFFHYCNNEEKYVVFDIGMNIAAATLYFAERNNVKNVFSFEPFKKTFEQAIHNIEKNIEIKQKIKPFNYGLSNKNDIVDVFFDNSKKSAMSTLIEVNVKGKFNNCSKDKVNVKNAADVIKKIMNEEKSIVKYVLKMDCEGEEYNIFDTLKKNDIIGKFDIIMLEWHYKGSEMLEEVLKERGFSYFKFIRDKDTGLIYAIKNKYR